MADDHNCSIQDVTVPDRAVGQDSLLNNSPPRGPRTLLLRRGENGFGFTLRHFIVYPPESCYMLPGHERTNIDEPMDTIFVKQVRANSPAAEAGLRTGDRVVSVDGNPTRGEQYASVVQRIQQAGPWLRLLVVSKEDDILQKYFGETAHNPETNQRPRLRSPERLSQKQRRSIGLLQSNSSRARQSWVCSPSASSSPALENQSAEAMDKRAQSPPYLDEPKIYSSATMPRKKSLQESRWKSSSPTVQLPAAPSTLESSGAMSTSLLSRLRGPSISHHDIDRFHTYDGRSSRPGSVYSRADSERLYDRIKDPIYERVKSDNKSFTESLDRHRFPVSRAEPQVPIYRSVTRRVVSRRASEGATADSESEVGATGTTEGGSQRGSVSPSKDSYSSFDSNSTLTGESPGDMVIMSRIRKSFEQKEEFLRRPSHPIGWFLAEKAGAPRTPSRSDRPQGIIQREFYARPQKLQKQVWPPEGQGLPVKSANVDTKVVKAPLLASKSKSEDSTSSNNNNNNSSCNNNNSNNCNNNHHACPANSANGKIPAAFVSTLSRIHENSAGLAQQQSQELRNGTSSLPSSPGPDKKVMDKFPVPPQGLQIVSRRTKQFESGCLMSDEDEPVMGDRTHLYKSELSRLTNKRSVPNVAVRKREFESKVEIQDQRRIINRESKSLEAGSGLSGNRIIPVGSKNIHCVPPADQITYEEPTTTSEESVQLRARSNSFESWAAVNDPIYKSVRHTWQDQPGEEADDKRNITAKRQDSYLRAVRDQIGSSTNTNSNGVVLRRPKNTQISDEDRSTRRVSYLKATWAERMHIDSDLELSDSEPVQTIIRDSVQIQNLESDNVLVRGNDVEREGLLCVKFTVLDGKRSTDRSWKQAWGVLCGPILYFYKDRHSQSPSTTTDDDTVPNVDIRCSVVDVADDYTKRKNVLRVANTSAEVLLQTEDTVSMALWLRALQKHAAAEKPSDATSTTSKQLAVPQTPGPTTSANSSNTQQVQRLSPLPSHKGIRKLTSFRNRSPTGQSPVSKTRKPSQNIELLSPSPKSKTWKGRVAKQLRKMHSQAGSPSSPTTQLPPTGATFKVPLEFCRPSTFSEYVPLIVEMCTKIVEARGLEVIGIYRVPGNTAAISQLTESVNKGFEHINLQDPRWSDVNVISSLLKSFFRQLPDSLLTATLYPMFIDADKIEDPQRRMATIRKLLRDLPEHHFETLKHLMFHLKKVVEHSEANKMEAKNLAIVFGPTLVRASGSRDNMITMVTDMSHQCRIVESLLNNVDWFFSDDDSDDLSRLSVNLSLPTDSNDNMDTTSQSNHSLLLNNIHKVEGMREMNTAKDIVSSIISAANRKIQRRRKGHDETDNDDHDHDKHKSKHETDNITAIRQSMALNERLCSVSEIVQMHESKTLNHEKFERPSNNAETDFPIPTPRQKYSNYQAQRGQEKAHSELIQIETPPRSNSQMQDSAKFCSVSPSATPDRMSMISSGSTDTKQSNDEVTIRSYANLSATTQERIRRFEQETKAMLQRDQYRHRREAEKREEEKRRIEMEWQLAKKEMEDEDDLDNIVDSTVSPKLIAERWSNLNDRIESKMGTVADVDRGRSKSAGTSKGMAAGTSAEMKEGLGVAAGSQQLGEVDKNGVNKKLKTDKEISSNSNLLTPSRYGSLDSLHEFHSSTKSSSSPTAQHRGLSGEFSDDGPGGASAKTPLPKATAASASCSSVVGNLGYPAGSPDRDVAAAATAPAAIEITAASVASALPATPAAADATSDAQSRAQPPSLFQFLDTSGLSGATEVSSKIISKFLRGSDLLTSLTSTFDRKWKSLLNPSSATASPSTTNLSSPSSSSNHESFINVGNIPSKIENDKLSNQKLRSSEMYRDPSLHKAPLEIVKSIRPENNVEEKDTDSTKNPPPDLIPNNDRLITSNTNRKISRAELYLDATEKDEHQKPSSTSDLLESTKLNHKEPTDDKEKKEPAEDSAGSANKSVAKDELDSRTKSDDPSYSNKLERFERLSKANLEPRSRLKRSESLNKRTENRNAQSKLKRSESLNKHSYDRSNPVSPSNDKLQRSESLNKQQSDCTEQSTKLKRSESLTKTEKTESNISKRRQSVRKESTIKLKRKNGMPERSIKRRHTVGGTKDFDKVHWLDNKLQADNKKVCGDDGCSSSCAGRPAIKKSQLRTSSPDLSSNRYNLTDASFLIEVSFRGPSNVIFNVTNASNTRPQSLPDANLASKVFKVPLESHV